jgi:hypothetical protein
VIFDFCVGDLCCLPIRYSCEVMRGGPIRPVLHCETRNLQLADRTILPGLLLRVQLEHDYNNAPPTSAQSPIPLALTPVLHCKLVELTEM